MPMFTSGILLQQHKEPAFSHAVIRFVNPQTDFVQFAPVCDKQRDDLSPDDIIDIARAAKIVDERDGKLLYRKLLRTKSNAIAVIADAVDDEPYVSSQIGPMIKLRDEACGGIALCERVAGVEKGSAMILAYKHISDLATRIPAAIEGYKVVRLRGGYPAESYASQLQVGVGRKLIVGAGALIHLNRAVEKRLIQTSTFITVAGNCIASSMNLEISLGITVAQVLERCGLNDTPTRIVCGGPMTGRAISQPERTAVTYTTRAILAIKESKLDSYSACIGCGRCQQNCPSGLNPMYIYRFVTTSYMAGLEKFDAHLCTGCGICSYMCPSRLNVSYAVGIARDYANAHFSGAQKEADDLEA